MKRSYRIRYHLAKGPNFMKWQIRNKDLGIEDYFDPASFVYTCKNGKLNNSSRTAQRIHDGDNKTVCSWISYSEFGSVNQTLESFGVMSRISYNPRLKPHWTSWDFEEANIDGFEGDVYIINKSLYVRTEELKRFLSNAVELKTA